MKDRDYRFFDVAKSVAKLSTWSDVPREQVGAVIVLRNEVISTGYNRSKGNMLHGHFAAKAGRPEAAYAHAETSALSKFRNMSWLLKEFHLMKIYVYRETVHGIAMARPCNICTLALKSVGINQIYDTTDDGYAEEVWK